MLVYLHLVPDSVQLAAIEVEDDQAIIRAKSTIAYTGIGIREITLCTELMDAEGNVVAADEMPSVTVEEHSEQEYQQKMYAQTEIVGMRSRSIPVYFAHVYQQK